MKKKYCHITGILLASLCLLCSSCINEIGGSPSDEQGKGEGFFSIHLSTEPTRTKAPVTEIDPWEHRVDKVWILLYNEENKLEHKFDLNVRNYETNPTLKLTAFSSSESETMVDGSGETLSFTSYAKIIKRKTYKMAVLANPSTSITALSGITLGSNLSNLTNAINAQIAQFGSYAGEANAPAFFMSNANGLITVPVSALQPTIEKAHASPVKVNLDRLLAKVSVKEKENGVTIKTQDVVIDTSRPVQWYLDVTNKMTYLIRQYARLAGGNVLENETNSPADRKNVYAEDPNFLLADNQANKFNRWALTDVIPYNTWVSKTTQDPGLPTYEYVLENTLDLDAQKNSNWSDFTTQIVLKVHLVYKNFLLNPADPTNDSDPNRNYYSCLLDRGSGNTQWRVFTQEQAAHWLDRGFPTSSDTEENAWLALLKAKIEKIQADYKNKVAGAFDFSVAQPPGVAESLYRTYDGVTYHPLGLNIYKIPIKHFGTFTSTSTPREVYGYYGVVRNNMYTVTINSIEGPGNGIYDWENRFISASISITPWYKRDFQGEDLE